MLTLLENYSLIFRQREIWEPVGSVVADLARQDNDKRNNIQIYTEIPY